MLFAVIIFGKRSSRSVNSGQGSFSASDHSLTCFRENVSVIKHHGQPNGQFRGQTNWDTHSERRESCGFFFNFYPTSLGISCSEKELQCLVCSDDIQFQVKIEDTQMRAPPVCHCSH